MKKGRLSKTRFSSGDIGLDAVLGSGFVSGNLVILFGPAGIGKTSLLTGVAISVAKRTSGRAIWLSSEEMEVEFRTRMRRIYGIAPTLYEPGSQIPENLEVKTNHKTAFSDMTRVKFVIVDCLSTGPSMTGEVTRLGDIARSFGTSVVAISHSTKDGGMPRAHLVRHEADTVLAMEPVKANHDGTWEKVRKSISTSWSRVRVDGKNRDGDSKASAIYRMTASGPVGISSM